MLRCLVQWMADYGVQNAVERFHDEAIGRSGYGRPNEDSERRSYAFSGLVALWHKAWPEDLWPAALNWTPTGEKLWTPFVEPPWEYATKGESVLLDVMGTKRKFSLRKGPGHIG